MNKLSCIHGSTVVLTTPAFADMLRLGKFAVVLVVAALFYLTIVIVINNPR